MPWSRSHFPPSMHPLSPLARSKAIETANAVLERGCDEGKAIRIGIAQGKRWASADLAGETEARDARG